MSQSLFLDRSVDLGFEKTASAETTVSDNSQSWPSEIIQELYKQAPYVADFDPHVILDKVDPERGYAFGHVEIICKTEIQPGTTPESMEAAGVKLVRVPVIIKDKKLQPLDILITEKHKMLPMTDTRIRQALFRPQTFDVTSRTPGDQSLVGALFPPYRQNYGYGGGGSTLSVGMGKEGQDRGAAMCDTALQASAGKYQKLLGHLSAAAEKASPKVKGKYAKLITHLNEAHPSTTKKASLLAAILPTVNSSDYDAFIGKFASADMRAAYLMNANATEPSLQLLLSFTPDSLEKRASALKASIQPDVVQISRLPEGGYTVKSASSKCWEPEIIYLTKQAAVAYLGGKTVLAADLNGATTVVEGATTPVENALSAPEKIIKAGTYTVKDSRGKEYSGFALPSLIDLTGADIPLGLFSDGTNVAIQSDMVGIPTGEELGVPEVSPPRGHGFFFTTEGGEIKATIPMHLLGETRNPEGTVSHVGETFDGRPVEVIQGMPNLGRISQDADGKVLLPDSFQWSSLGGVNPLDLVTSPEAFLAGEQAKQAFDTVEIRGGGPNSFSIRGMPVDKVARDQREGISIDEAMFLLGGLGVDSDFAVNKLAQAFYEESTVLCPIGRTLHMQRDLVKQANANARAALASIPNMRVDLSKEAAYVPDPGAVDSLLSLGFINPENTATFISYIPKIEEAQENMCELLVASRVGLKDLPTNALERAIASVEKVLEGLKLLAFSNKLEG